MVRKSLVSPAVEDQQQQQAQFLQLLLAGILGNGHQRGKTRGTEGEENSPPMKQLYLQQLGLQQHHLQQQFQLFFLLFISPKRRTYVHFKKKFTGETVNELIVRHVNNWSEYIRDMLSTKKQI